MNSEQPSLNPIKVYAELVLQYLSLGDIASKCKNQRDWANCLKTANVFVEDGFYDIYTDLQLYNFVMQEYKNVILNVSHELLNQLDVGGIEVKRDGETL
jgi:hypothetical protein